MFFPWVGKLMGDGGVGAGDWGGEGDCSSLLKKTLGQNRVRLNPTIEINNKKGGMYH